MLAHSEALPMHLDGHALRFFLIVETVNSAVTQKIVSRFRSSERVIPVPLQLPMRGTWKFCGATDLVCFLRLNGVQVNLHFSLTDDVWVSWGLGAGERVAIRFGGAAAVMVAPEDRFLGGGMTAIGPPWSNWWWDLKEDEKHALPQKNPPTAPAFVQVGHRKMVGLPQLEDSHSP
jgi:hypothetical protein